ncbi:MAG: 50S ribosomal protein L21 [Proteobacteria bacterium]|nr:50S ribosomal protein L21 [Pseudomonadota bacterium]
MFAVVETGGKQYRVSPGEELRIERLDGLKGDEVVFDRVLLVSGEGEPRVGTPHVSGAKVTGKVVHQGRHKKILVFKYKKRKRYRVKTGHRQPYTLVRISAIEG